MQIAQVPAFSLAALTLCVSFCGNMYAADASTEGARDLFGGKDWRPPVPRTQASPAPKPEATVPPFPYQYVGRMEAAGKGTVHFTKDDRLYSFTVGDTIDGAYRVDDITPQGVQLTYLPLSRKQFVAYSSIAAPTAPQASTRSSPGGVPIADPRASSANPVPAPFPNTGTGGIQGNNVVTNSPTPGAPVTAPGGATDANASAAGARPGAGVSPEAAAAAAQSSAAAAAAMGVSRPATSAMPMSAPTITSMPVLAPGADMPLAAPSGAPMTVAPPGSR